MSNKNAGPTFELSTVSSIQLLIAALIHIENKECERSQGRFSENKHRNRIELYENWFAILNGTPSISQHAKTVSLVDFQFSNGELFDNQRLILFLPGGPKKRSIYWPLVDRDSPISENLDLNGSGTLHNLAKEWYSWHMKNWQGENSERPFAFGNSIEHLVFRGMRFDHFQNTQTETETEAYNLRRDDGTYDAAKEALHLIDKGMSKNAAVKTILTRFQIVPVIKTEFDFNVIVSNSEEAAYKKVKRKIDDIQPLVEV